MNNIIKDTRSEGQEACLTAIKQRVAVLCVLVAATTLLVVLTVQSVFARDFVRDYGSLVFKLTLILATGLAVYAHAKTLLTLLDIYEVESKIAILNALEEHGTIKHLEKMLKEKESIEEEFND